MKRHIPKLITGVYAVFVRPLQILQLMNISCFLGQIYPSVLSKEVSKFAYYNTQITYI